MILYIVTFSIILWMPHLCKGKPQSFSSRLTESEARKVLSRDFAPPKGNLDLPPIPKSTDFINFEKNPYNFHLNNDGSGNYYFGYSVYGGPERAETGELKNAGTENEIQTMRGQYIDRYVTLEGSTIVRTIGYIADENGYQPFLINITVEPPRGGGGLAGGGLGGGSGGYASPVGGKKGGTGISSAAQAALIGGGFGK